jgi:hypothetical protein
MMIEMKEHNSRGDVITSDLLLDQAAFIHKELAKRAAIK